MFAHFSAQKVPFQKLPNWQICLWIQKPSPNILTSKMTSNHSVINLNFQRPCTFAAILSACRQKRPKPISTKCTIIGPQSKLLSVLPGLICKKDTFGNAAQSVNFHDYFISLRFYVKSILGLLEVGGLEFWL